MVEKLRKIGTAGRKLWKSVSTSTRNSFNCYVEYWFRRSKQISVVKKVCLNVKETRTLRRNDEIPLTCWEYS
jgi:hypothetical protein